MPYYIPHTFSFADYADEFVQKTYTRLYYSYYALICELTVFCKEINQRPHYFIPSNDVAKE